jgi:2-keto-4-pentenoate hydratase
MDGANRETGTMGAAPGTEAAGAELAALTGRLWEARQKGDHSPAWLNGALDLDGALAVQLGLLARKVAAGERLAGWKVGLTSERARKALGVDARPFGHLLASRVFPTGAALRAAEIAHPSIEPELCFTIGRRVAGAEPSRAEVAGALARVSAGFEINERRAGSARPDFCAMVTDCLTQWGIVEGQGVEPGAAPDLGGVRCALFRDGAVVYQGVSRDELDDHLESLRRLVAALAAHGLALEPGQKVITGAFARFDAAAGQSWRAVYDGIGAVEVSFR